MFPQIRDPQGTLNTNKFYWCLSPQSLCRISYSSAFCTNRHDSSWSMRTTWETFCSRLMLFPPCLSVGTRMIRSTLWDQGQRVLTLSLTTSSLSCLISYHHIFAVITFPNLKVVKMSSSPFSSFSYFFCNCFCFVFSSSHYQSR